ncbi:DnaD domain protein [Oceanobacillus caeni]|uniref:DnaD domain protein n=1 Tax=Oceanobacillus caeni TaxID=405946 RepID=UPI001C226F39|nr:DnaD domain protein [Oceanobacillus caeni]MBU8791154.1 DnaD domain protein [Oceanobacillus caeni]
MNMWKEMSAFRDWLLLNEMSSSGIVLWYSLFTIWNKVGCQCKFNVPNSTLMKLTGLSKQGLINARATLIQKGFIHYEKGKKGRAPVYQLNSLVHSVDPSVYQLPTQSTTETLPLIDDLRERRRRGRRIASEKLLVTYEQNFGSLPPIVMKSLHDWCDELDEEIVMEAIKFAVKKGGKTFSYLEKILEKWNDAGLKSRQDLRHYIKRPKAKNTVLFQTRKKSEKPETLFDELRREGERV